MAQSKVVSMIGMAIRAGKAGRGSFQAERDVKSGQACLLILASDASENTRKKFTNMARYYGVDILEAATCSELGHLCRKDALAVVTIQDEQLKRAVLQAAQREETALFRQ